MKRNSLSMLAAALLVGAAAPAGAAVYIQCPGDVEVTEVIDDVPTVVRERNAVHDPDETAPPGTKCVHLFGGDGFVKMADGYPLYIFGFGDVTGVPESRVLRRGELKARFPAPPLAFDQGDQVYLTLTNVGMALRPDLFDPHTVHFHGDPNSSTIFDGLPESGIAVNMGASITYYYNMDEPGTYMYHCHVEATEHMQMGMLGSFYVRAAQNNTPPGTLIGNHVHRANHKYVYNDGDGSTMYQVEKSIQIGSFDSAFHDASVAVQPLPFAAMRDNYPMLNGRGYPDTVVPTVVHNPDGFAAQRENSLVTAKEGQRILLRLSNLNVTRYYTLATPGLTMKVVGTGAKQLRSPTGEDLYYETTSVTLGGGESVDVIIDTRGVAPGTYFLHTTNLNYLSNNRQDFGGMLTEIRITPRTVNTAEAETDTTEI
ncbi:MAG: multicopper oxidase domain-containing protein [Thiohalomonadaceae bacterium]